MVDASPYGEVWRLIAEGSFDLEVFRTIVESLPDQPGMKGYCVKLANDLVDLSLMPYHYLILQSAAFGGKPVWTDGRRWITPSFRSYWMPTETSIRRSPTTATKPLPAELYRRVQEIVGALSGVITAGRIDINDLDIPVVSGDVIYVDPPYEGTSGYGSSINLNRLTEMPCDVYVSEAKPIPGATSFWRLDRSGRGAGITGSRTKEVHAEYLSLFQNS
jgi:hypothetical protein